MTLPYGGILTDRENRLALDGAGGHALDDVLLAEHVHDDDGQNCHHDDGHGSAQVNGAVAALQVLDMDGDGAVLGDIQDQVGEQIVVPDPHQL